MWTLGSKWQEAKNTKKKLTSHGFIYTMLDTDGTPRQCSGKASVCNAEDPVSIPGLRRSPGEENGNPLQYSCLENSLDRGAWQATVPGVARSRTRLTTTHTRWWGHYATVCRGFTWSHGSVIQNMMLFKRNHQFHLSTSKMRMKLVHAIYCLAQHQGIDFFNSIRVMKVCC